MTLRRLCLGGNLTRTCTLILKSTALSLPLYCSVNSFLVCRLTVRIVLLMQTKLYSVRWRSAAQELAEAVFEIAQNQSEVKMTMPKMLQHLQVDPALLHYGVL